MSNLPALKSPYLRIDDALERFKLSGVRNSSDNVSRLIKEADDGKLKIHLLLNPNLNLIEEKYVKPLVKMMPPLDYHYDIEGLLEEKFTQEDIDEFIEELEPVDWLIISEDAVLKEFDRPMFITPLQVKIQWNSDEIEVSESGWLHDEDAENLSAVEIDGLVYFVVKDLTDNPLFPDIEKTHEENGHIGIVYCLDEYIVHSLIERGDHVVTRDEILAYEEEFLSLKRANSLAEHKALGLAFFKANSNTDLTDLFDDLPPLPATPSIEDRAKRFVWHKVLSEKKAYEDKALASDAKESALSKLDRTIKEIDRQLSLDDEQLDCLNQSNSETKLPKQRDIKSTENVRRDLNLWLRNAWEELRRPRACRFLTELRFYEDEDGHPINGSPIVKRITAGENQGIRYIKRDGDTGHLKRITLEKKVSRWKTGKEP